MAQVYNFALLSMQESIHMQTDCEYSPVPIPQQVECTFWKVWKFRMQNTDN